MTAAIGFPDLSLASLNGAMPHVGQTLGVCFTQPTPTQIKVGPINFWPQGKGGIDGCAKHPEQGWDAFIKLLQRHGLTPASNEVQQSLASSPLAPNRSRPAHSIPSLSPPARRQIKAALPSSPWVPAGGLCSWVARAERQRQSTSENSAAPIAKTITVAGDRSRGADDDVIRRCQIGNAREMDIEHCDQRSGLRELVL